MKTIKRSLSWLLILTMLLSLMAGFAISTEAATTTSETPTETGTFGDRFYANETTRPSSKQLRWSYYASTKELIVETDDPDVGGILLPDYASSAETPWAKYRNEIAIVRIGKGIYRTGEYVFADMRNLKVIRFESEELYEIADYSFHNCTSLKSVDLTQSIKVVQLFAFSNCTNITTFTYYFGTNIKSADLRAIATLYYQTSGNSGSTSSDMCGTSVKWTFDPITGTLTISGTGNMYDFSDGRALPWQANLLNIKTLKVEEGVTSIGKNAFSGAQNLQTIRLPSTLTWIDNYAFLGCVGITDATIQRAATSPVNEGIGNTLLTNKLRYLGSSSVTPTPTVISGQLGTTHTWSYNPNTYTLTITALSVAGSEVMPQVTPVPWAHLMTSIRSLVIGEGIYTVATGAMANASALTTISFPSTMVTVADGAFAGCNAIVGATVARSSSLPVTVGNNNGKLNTISLTYTSGGSSSTTVGGNLPNNLKWTYDIATRVMTITGTGSMAAFDASNPIPWYQYTTSIEKLVVGEGVTSIANSAFSGATALRTVTLPSTITRVENNAFNNCTLTTATAGCAERQLTIVSSGNQSLKDKIIYLGEGTSSNPSTPDTSNTLLNGLTWSYNSTTHTLTISGTGEMAAFGTSNPIPWYSNMTSIQRVTIGEGVKSIAASAFSGATALLYVSLPSTMATIGTNAFSGCTQIAGATVQRLSGTVAISSGNQYLTNKLTYLNGGGSTNVTDSGTMNYGLSWSYDDTTKTLVLSGDGEMALITTQAPWSQYTSKIETLIVSEGVRTIADYAFSGATSLSTVRLPSTLTRIGNYAFQICNKLNSVVAYGENGYIKIGDYGNNKLKEVISYVGSGASTPTSGQLPNGLSWVFDTAGTLTISGSGTMAEFTASNVNPWLTYMSQIRKIVVAENVKTIAANAFNGATLLNTVELPSTLTAVGNNAFNNCGGMLLATANGVQNYFTIGSGNTDLTDHIYYLKGNGSSTTPVTGSLPNNLTWTYNTTTRTLTISGSGSMAAFTNTNPIPWASYMSQIEKLVVSENVQSIAPSAFNGASALHTLTLPSTLTSIGANAFNGCVNIYSAEANTIRGAIDISSTGNTFLTNRLTYKNDSTTPPITGGDVGATIPGTSLTWSYNPTTHSLNLKISGGNGVLPNYSATSPAPWAAYADGIEAITVQSGITSIGNNAFAGMKNVVDVYLPDTVTSIGNDAFNGCTSLKTIKLPSALTYLGEAAFRNCSALESIEIPSSIRVIENETFYDCVSLTSVTLNEGLEEIGDSAFYNCKALKMIAFPSTLNYIGEDAFWGCSGLTGVVISGSPLNVDKNAFAGCKSLVKVILDDCDEPVAFSGNEALTTHYVEAVASGTLENGVTWTVDRVAGVLTFTGEGEVVRESEWAAELPFVDTVHFGNGITAIGAGVLRDDDNVECVTMADSVTTIGEGAFERCEALKRVTFSRNLTQMGANAFAGCTSLTEVDLPTSLTVIPEGAFKSCTSLTSLTLGDKVTTIGTNAFANCKLLTELFLPETVASLGDAAFKDCVALKKITLYGGTLSPLQKGIFDGCAAIDTVDFLGSSSAWRTLTANADEELTVGTRVSYKVTYTIYYVFQGGQYDGQQAAATRYYTGNTGERVTIDLPVVEHHTVKPTPTTFLLGEDNATYTVYYSPSNYTVTIQYLDRSGNSLAAATTLTLQHGETTTVSAIDIVGYRTDAATAKREVNVDNGNTTVVFYYDIDSYTYTVQYVNQRTGKVIDFITGTLEYLGDLTLTAADMPTIANYTLANANGTWTITDIADNNQVIAVEYIPKDATVTIHYVDEGGTKIKEDQILPVYFGGTFALEYPAITGYTAPAAPTVLDNYDGKTTEITLAYTRNTYTVTVTITQDGVPKFQNPYTFQVKHGDKFRFDLNDPAYAGILPTGNYEAKQPVLEISAVTKDEALEMAYTRKAYKMTVFFFQVGVNGASQLYAPLELTATHGEDFTFVLDTELYPIPEGYELSQLTYTVKNVTEDTPKSVNINYTIKKYAVTIRFHEAETVDYSVFKDVVVMVPHGEAFSFDYATSEHAASEAAKYYVLDRTQIAYDAVTEDKQETIICTKKQLTLTVEYKDGTKVVKTETYQVPAGSQFVVPSLTLDGYMPTEDTEVHTGSENLTETIELEKDSKNNVGTIIAVVAIVVVVLAGGGVAFYFLYLKKKPF